MSGRSLIFALLLAAFSAGAYAQPKPPKDQVKVTKADRKDPAFRHGYDDGYRVGANDSRYNSNSYNDQNSSVYDDAIDGYYPKYGDVAQYQRLFRLGYIAGYKAGWDFNAGRYPPFGGPDDGP